MTANMHSISSDANYELDRNQSQRSPPKMKKKAVGLSLLSLHPTAVPVSSDMCAPFNFSSISLSLLPRHEVPWCSDALGCVAVGHRFSAAALSHLLWFVNKDIQSLIHHEGFPLKRVFTLPLLSWRGVPWFALIPSSVTFFSFLWCWFPLKRHLKSNEISTG